MISKVNLNEFKLKHLYFRVFFLLFSLHQPIFTEEWPQFPEFKSLAIQSTSNQLNQDVKIGLSTDLDLAQISVYGLYECQNEIGVTLELNNQVESFSSQKSEICLSDLEMCGE